MGWSRFVFGVSSVRTLVRIPPILKVLVVLLSYSRHMLGLTSIRSRTHSSISLPVYHLYIIRPSEVTWPRCRGNVFTELLPSNNKGYTKRPTDSTLIRHGPHRKRRIKRFFAAVGTPLLSCYLATVRGTQRDPQTLLR
jgi:hypothetical protein